jgi:hypothetical protein
MSIGELAVGDGISGNSEPTISLVGRAALYLSRFARLLLSGRPYPADKSNSYFSMPCSSLPPVLEIS